MNSLSKHRLLFVNLLIALGISMVINFSYFFMWTQGNIYVPQGRPGDANTLISDMSIGMMVFYQVAYYMLISYGMLLILFTRINENNYKFWDRVVLCFVLSIVFYQLSPQFGALGGGRNTPEMFTFQSRRMMNPTQALKSFFLLVVTCFYTRLYKATANQQRIMIENEQLKSMNVEARYDMLVNQINPHFFFNSLNSLSMLIRNNKKPEAIDYIENLSDTFRYILKNGQQGVVKLSDEISFTQSYKYLHEIRYQDKLFIDIKIDNSLYDKKLPTMSLQPLIENAVKHNVISSEQIFTISIYVKDNYLCVSNPIIPKAEQPTGMGIGLENMSSRYNLLIEKDIEIINDGKTFIVKLPLID